MRITMVGILVDDQDRAKAFYTEKLGFRLKSDAPYSESERWLAVADPADADGTELMLGLANDAGRAFQRAQYGRGKPAIAFTTDDCRREYQRLRAHGVKFTVEPTKMEYGGTDAVFDDTCGNLICIHQD
ncbi:MAG: VOC family protein [Kutzneria sp.]|nr:VOC family protein [Kutzneria sp.]MBV9844023.1 VOC family protein [Kutzneria sp.]